MNSVKENSYYLKQLDLEKNDFERVRQIIYDYSGINLHDGKQALVRARLMKRIRKLGLSNFKEYLDAVENDTIDGEFYSFVDVLTTNKTSFFREHQHFDFMCDEVIPKLSGRNVRWWSAGCSSGEEPVTMAITLFEEFSSKTVPVKILATDLSRDMLLQAKHGIYSEEKMDGVPGFLLKRYFRKQEDGKFKIHENIRKMITYGRLNLKADWPFKHLFQVIMCRNVMIYFDSETQNRLVSRFYNQLEPGGYLFLGHSESINGKNSGFVNVRPAVYQKKG